MTNQTQLPKGYYLAEVQSEDKNGFTLMKGTDNAPCQSGTNIFFEGTEEDALDYFKGILHIFPDFVGSKEILWVKLNTNKQKQKQ